MELLELLKSIGVWLLGVLGTSAVLGGIAVWVGKLIADRLVAATNARYEKEMEQIRNQYSRELEELRSELTGQRDMRLGTHGALASSYAGAYERVVTAIEFLWTAMVETRKFVDPYIFMYQILLRSEYEDVSEEAAAKIKGMIPKHSTAEFHSAVVKLREGLNEKRPFLGERLWWLHYVYFAFGARLALKVRDEREHGRFYAWNKNPDGSPDQMQKILDFVFSKEELEQITGPAAETETGTAKDLGIPQRILDGLENKILVEMNEWIFGRRLVSMSIEEQHKVVQLLASDG